MSTLILIAAAWSAPLVHTGDETGAVALAEELTGREGWEPRAWDSLRVGAPVALGGSEVFATCEPGGPPVDDALRSFRGAVLYGDPDVQSKLTAAQRAMACGGASPEQLATMAFLAGVAAHDAGDEPGATAWFATSRTWSPGFAFDTDFPSELAPVFDAAKPSEARFALTVVPDAGLTVNGAAPAPVPAGPHLVHTAGRGFWIRTGAFPETVVWPDAVSEDALAAVTEESGRSVVTRVLAVGLGEGESFGLVSGDTVWTGTAGRTDWKAYEPAQVGPAPAPEPVDGPRRKSKTGPLVLTGIGVVSAGIGGALAAEAWHPAGTEPARHPTETEHDAARLRYWVGWGAVAGGTALTGGGLVWMVTL